MQTTEQKRKLLQDIPKEHQESVAEIYGDYPEIPYISPDRDFERWLRNVKRFNSIVPVQNMVRLPEDLLPGHIVLLWRISFNNLRTNSIFSNQYEGVYGMKPDRAVDELINAGYVSMCSLEESYRLFTRDDLMKILRTYGIPFENNLKKQDLYDLAVQKISYEILEQEIMTRLYALTDEGIDLLHKYNAIIVHHQEESGRVTKEIEDHRNLRKYRNRH